MLNNQKIINRIKKCLMLAQSSNSFEAKRALSTADTLMKKYNIDSNIVNSSYMNDENKYNDPCREKSTFELYRMWKNSAIGSERAYFIEKIIKYRTDKWIDELEENEFKNSNSKSICDVIAK